VFFCEVVVTFSNLKPNVIDKETIMRKTVLTATFLLLAAQAGLAAEKPNIIFILADDLG